MKLWKNVTNKTKINTSSWKEFFLIDLFEVKGTKTTSKNKLIKKEGIYPYVTTTSKNNGIEFYSNIWTEKGNCLVVDSAVAGYMSYQDKNFTASDHVEKLIPKFFMSKEIAMFICCIWNCSKMNKKYSYILKASQTQLKKETIFLPVLNNEIDWNYMEKYILEVHNKIYLNLQD